MTDPAAEAVERAFAPAPWFPVSDPDVAREALAPIRDLHQPARDGAWLVCAHCSAGASFVRWPCDTALLIYTSEELSNE